MASLVFRDALLDDLSTIIRLLADDVLGREREIVEMAGMVELPIDQRYIDAFKAIAEDPNQRLIVALKDEAIIGTLQLSFIPGLANKGAWRGQIEAVRIAASARGMGLGQQMLTWAIAQCRARGCQLVQLTTNKSRHDAHRFYEKLGFIASHQGYKLFFEDASI